MDIEGSFFSTNNDLLSFHYPLNSTEISSPCSSNSILLSSPWPVSSTPSPPSSTSSSTVPSPCLNEGKILPSSSPLSEASSCPELGLGTAVIFTTTSVSSEARTTCSPPFRVSAALTLVDPVSPHAVEVAHAPEKSILRVHEQDHGDLIHFSTSCATNRVNGNANRSSSDTTKKENCNDDDRQKGVLLETGNLSSSPTTSSSNTDGNLFPTLILTSTSNPNMHTLINGGEHNHHQIIPMRLYATLTSPPSQAPILTGNNCENAIGSSTVIASLGESGEMENSDGSATTTACMIMTTPDITNSCHSDTDFNLTGFTSTNDLVGNSEVNTLGASSNILMENYTEEVKEDHNDITLTKFSACGDPMDEFKEYSLSHCKLKDILMNGHIHHSNNLNSSLLSSTAPCTNGDSYILRDLEAAAVIFNRDGHPEKMLNSVENVTSKRERTFLTPKEESCDLEVHQLHPTLCEEQSTFTDAINSIYTSSTVRNMFCDGNADLTTINNSDLLLVSAEGERDIGESLGNMFTSSGETLPSTVLTVTPASLISSMEHSPSNGLGVATKEIRGQKDSSNDVMMRTEDFLELDDIDDDDLLEAKEERDDLDYGGEIDDGGVLGGKGELKCKFCGFVCCSKSSLGIHERRHTGERPFACKYCGRMFNSAQCCKHHERLHTGDKPFQCSYCGKKYAVSTRLKRHERVHTREEPYKCNECNKTFRWFDAFRDHRNTHSGVPLYLCSVCGKTFTSYLKFYYHERGHLMKKERDRDRLVKQSGLSNRENLLVKKMIAKQNIIPLGPTIDILQSLHRNSSASIISTLNANAALIANTGGTNSKKVVGVGGKGQGQSGKKSLSTKTTARKSSSQIGKNNFSQGPQQN